MRQFAPGLAYYSTLEADIRQCQIQHGKKIFLSIGGQGNTLPLASDQDATTFANRIWEMFGPVGRIDPGLRPFGSAVLDGFDLNKQDECAANFDTLAATLRSRFAADTSADYFLSAAPGCSYPDVSIHPGYLAQSDFVWPRFYDDSRCGVGSDGFGEAVERWSDALQENAIPTRDGTASYTRLYVGLPARDDVFGGLSGGIRGLAALVAQIKAVVAGPDTFGGIMVSSEGGLGLKGVLEGMSLLAWVKRALVKAVV